MGFPIPYAGMLPKLLFTAAISMAALKDLCTSLLEFLGISSYIATHNLINSYDVFPSHQQPDDDQSSLLAVHHPQYDWYFNPHLHTPSDRRLLLCRSTFSEAVQASLPVVLYGELPMKQVSQAVCELPSSPSSSSSVSSTQVKLQELTTAEALQYWQKHDLCASSISAPPISSSSSSSSPSSSPSISSSPSLSPLYTPSSLASPYIWQQGMQNQQTVTATLPQTLSSTTAVAAAATALNHDREASNHCTECAICLCEFQGGQEVKELPECSHIFHKDCIDGWILHNHHTCPLCRSSLLTPTMALQEMLREQSELSLQLTTWFTSLQEEEETYSQNPHHHLHHQHQAFYFTLQQPAGQ